jgi:hypothetical protein
MLYTVRDTALYFWGRDMMNVQGNRMKYSKKYEKQEIYSKNIRDCGELLWVNSEGLPPSSKGTHN